MMNQLEDKLEELMEQDHRYKAGGYIFIREALDFTVEWLSKKEAKNRHVSASQLLQGIRKFSLKQHGPLAKTVWNEWGVFTTEDIGNMVFNMVNLGILGKEPHDKIEDFYYGYSFEEVFVKPFLPNSQHAEKEE